MSKIDHSLFDANEHALDGEFGACPDCGAKLLIKRSKNGAFLGCSRYPQCEFAKPLHDNTTVELKQIDGSQCPDCGLSLSIKKGRFGLFIGCTGYPDCHHIEAIKQQKDIHVACPSCHAGKLLKRTNKYGKSFYACDGYPKCKYVLNAPPVEKTCPKCQWSVLIEKKNDHGSYYQCPQKNCGEKVSAQEN